MDLEDSRGSPIYNSPHGSTCVCFRATAHAYCTPPTHKQARGRNPTLRGNTQYPIPAAQLALASSLIPDALKRLQEGVLTLTFPCESGGGMETV